MAGKTGSSRKARNAGSVTSIAGLGRELSVSYPTARQWVADGCPRGDDSSFDLVEVYVWCRRRGRKVDLPQDPDVAIRCRAALADAAGTSASAAPCDPEKTLTIADHDQKIGRPESWSEAQQREKTVGELIKNEEGRIQLAISRGAVIAVEDSRLIAIAVRDAFVAELKQLPAIVIEESGAKGEAARSLADVAERCVVRILTSVADR